MNKAIFYLMFVLFLASCTGQSERMYNTLLQAEEMNRNYQSFTSDSMGLALVHYYDRWYRRDANLKLRAYYMLGSAYRDMGEAPAAIHYYNIATEKADTTSSDCDYATLFRVYGQMAVIYEYQNLPYEELDAWEGYSHYALLAGDTLNYIYGIGRKVGAYYTLDDTLAILETSELAHDLYIEHDAHRQASDVYHATICIYLAQGKYQEAKELMDYFEKESGAFDSLGNIGAGREIYYEFKGSYYLGIQKVDSAEYFYRKLLNHNYDHVAYKGLLNVFIRREQTDSIKKYASLYENALMQWADNQQSSAIIQSSAMYKYERNQVVAAQKEREASRAKLFNMFLCIAGVTCLFLVYLGYRHVKGRILKKEKERRIMENQYKTLTTEYKQKCDDYELLLRNHELACQTYTEENAEIVKKTNKVLKEKYAEIQQYKEKLMIYERKIELSGEIEIERKMENTLTMKKCRDWVNRLSGEQPTEDDFRKLLSTFKFYQSHVYTKLMEAKLSRQELIVCVLFLLNFETYQIVTLLGKSPQSITNSKRSANAKLFNQNEADTLERNLKKLHVM